MTRNEKYGKNSEKIGKIWKKGKLNSEKIWKIWRKVKLNNEKNMKNMAENMEERQVE